MVFLGFVAGHYKLLVVHVYFHSLAYFLGEEASLSCFIQS